MQDGVMVKKLKKFEGRNPLPKLWRACKTMAKRASPAKKRR